MTPEQIALVEGSVAALKPRLDGIAEEFYRRLFAAEPECAALFTGDPAAQRAKFVAELEAILTSIRRHEEFLERASELGVRHYEYGARPRHYRVVGVALLDALAADLGERWTADVQQAWRLAYNLTAETMMAGARPSPQAD